MRFRGGQLLITTSVLWGGHQLASVQHKKCPAGPRRPHVHIPDMLPYSSSTATHAHTTSMHRTVTVYRSTVLTDYVSMHV